MRKEKSGTLRDILILVLAVNMIFSTFFWRYLPLLEQRYGLSASFRGVMSMIIMIIFALIFLGLAFTMKNLALKITAFVITGLYLLIRFLPSFGVL